MRRVLCDAILARLARIHFAVCRQRPPPTPPKRKNPFRPSGRKGLNQPLRLYQNHFTPAHLSQQNCANPERQHIHEGRPPKVAIAAPQPLSFRHASEARQEESALSVQRPNGGAPLLASFARSGIHHRNPHRISIPKPANYPTPQPLSFRRASEARQEESAVRQQRTSRACPILAAICAAGWGF
jgi:hypothetical protein